MKKFKIIGCCLTALGCLALFLCAGCAKPAKPSNQIEVWHWMTDRQAALETLAKKYEEQTGIKVKLELFAPSDTYTQKITAASQANVLPDVYGILDKKSIFALFIQTGYVADLTADFEADGGAWEKSIFPKALDVNRFREGNVDKVKPGIYGVPIDVTNMQMVYNKNLLKKAGISKVPATFDEFITAIEALRRVGVTPFVSGFGEMWLIDCFASNYAFNVLGEDKVMATFRGDVKYTDPEWVKVLGVFKTLASKGAFIEGIVTKGNKYAEQDFALERVAFAFNGSWCVNVYKDMNPKLDYGVAPLPALNISRPVKSWGGAGSSFVVNNTSPNKDKAIAFLKWLTATEQQIFLAEQTNNLPSNKEALASIPPVLADFARTIENTTHPSIWPLNEDPLVIEAFDKGIQAIIIGEKTPQQVAEEVQQVKEHAMQKRSGR
ncbi:MAG: extracellular solute-binding protein [Candidatus Omnitrophica bacterium]|nr:extracellular solute-binding protein [Candidatus Omnitrophota bacterium]